MLDERRRGNFRPYLESLMTRWPTSGTVDVWRIRLDRKIEELVQPERVLSPDEVARADRYRGPGLRGRFVVGRATLRKALGWYLGQPPEDLAFVYGPHGKPSLAGAAGLSFNLSHSADLALLAVTSGAEVGVDVEEMDIRRDVPSILGRFFAEGERSEYFEAPEPDRLAAFYRGWARKEAFLKALGTGLVTALDSFEVTLGAAPPLLRRVGDDPSEASKWGLLDVDAHPRFAAAVAVRGPLHAVNLRDWVD